MSWHVITKLFPVLAKEIQLQHKAPVLDIEVLDAKGSILTKDNEVNKYRREKVFQSGQKCQFQNISVGALPHKVLICSEEQVIEKLSAH